MHRHKTTGQLGYLEGRTIRLDRPSDPHARVSYVESEWEKTDEHRPLSMMQIAEVCYVMDVALSRYRGERPSAWINLTDKKKQAFESRGPSGDPIRQKAFASLKAILKNG